MPRLALVPLLAVLAVGCDDLGHVTANKGQVCIERQQVLEFKQDGALTLQVQSECLPSCIATEDTWCEASIDGPIIWVDSRFTWSEAEGECSEDCVRLTATCEVATAHPGEYTIRHGLDAYALQLPSNHLVECLSEMEDPDETAVD